MSPRAKALTTFWEASGLFALGCAQIFEMSALIFVGVTSMALGAVTVWADTHRGTSVPAPAAARPKPANPGGNKVSGRGRGRPGTAVPNCTRTGKPIDQCGCATRHVASAAGVRRYKQAKRIGDPLGGAVKPSTAKAPAAKKPQQPKVPTTNNAKPIPVGEHMRRVL